MQAEVRSGATSMVGQSIAHYRIVERIGAGGMGVVYKAEDLRLGRVVALKFLSPDLASSSTAVERFLREARTASSLNHPNICTIYSIEESDGQRFLAMELLEGRALVEVIGGRPMPPDTVIDLGIQIADALDAAHSQGVLHRDVKPANIFVTRRGLVKVLDFGLAKLALLTRDSDTHDTNPTMAEVMLTTQGLALGTVAYMSPEQARGESLDARSDIFSFGIVLYEMLTGQQAFAGRTSAVVFDAILNREPAALALFRQDIPTPLEAIVTRALEKEPGRRFQAMSELRDALARLKRERESGQFLAASSSPAEEDLSEDDTPTFIARRPTPSSRAITPRPPSAPVPVRAETLPSEALAPTVGVPVSRAPEPPPSVPVPVDDELMAAETTMVPVASGATPAVPRPDEHVRVDDDEALMAAETTMVPAASSVLPAPASVGGAGVATVATLDQVAVKPAPAVKPARPTKPPGRRSMAPVIGGIVVAVVVLWAAGAWWMSRNRSDTPTEPAATEPIAAAPQPELPTNTAAQGAITSAAANAVPGEVKGAAVPTRAPRPSAPRATVTPTPPPPAATPLSGTAIVPALPRASPQRVDPGALLLTAARTKYDAKLLDQALADVQSILREHATSPAAPAAWLLSARIASDQGRSDDAIQALTRLRSQFPDDAGNAEGALILARLLERTKRPDRVSTALAALGDVAQKFPDSPWAPRALSQRALIETRERVKAADSSLGAVPAAFLTYRTLVEKYPSSPEAEFAAWQLGSIYEDRKAWDRAASTYTDLATRFPQTRYDAWWKAAEIYEKRLKNDAAARAAYAKVPSTSPKYKDAQKRAQSR
jgi:serine/threonine protein kinase/tetratricopeptide (TPR) repeat protein